MGGVCATGDGAEVVADGCVDGKDLAFSDNSEACAASLSWLTCVPLRRRLKGQMGMAVAALYSQRPPFSHPCSSFLERAVVVRVAGAGCHCMLLFQKSGAVARNGRVGPGRQLWRSAVGGVCREQPQVILLMICGAAARGAPVMVWLQRRVSRTIIARSSWTGARRTAFAAAYNGSRALVIGWGTGGGNMAVSAREMSDKKGVAERAAI